jgi:hypothetical protein
VKAPYDGRFKILAEEYPDLLLRLLGIMGPGTKSQPIDIVRELQLDPVQVDHVYRIGDGESARLVHFEAISSWQTQRIPTLALYCFLLKRKFKLPVSSYIVLMAEKYAPKTMPERVVYEEEDGLRIEVPYKVIRLWEIDSSIAFEKGCEPLLPWVPLLEGGTAEFEHAIAAIERLLDHPAEAPYPAAAMMSNLATLAVLRYDKDAVGHYLERLVTKNMLSIDVFKDTWLYKDGVADGRAEGRVEGAIEILRTTLRQALNKKFPELGTLPEIDQIGSPDDLGKLLLDIIDAQNSDEAGAAVQAAVRVN